MFNKKPFAQYFGNNAEAIVLCERLCVCVCFDTLEFGVWILFARIIGLCTCAREYHTVETRWAEANGERFRASTPLVKFRFRLK